jgi:hypothetical protein
MANNCPCPDPNSEPDDVCCPDTIDVADAIDARDRSCAKRRIKPSGGKGILAVTKVNKWRASDGSSNQPVVMDFEQVASSTGYNIVQDLSGRLLALKPTPTGTEILKLVFADGELKFVPDNFSNQSINDDEITSVTSGVLAAIACDGEGRVKIGKFLPDCITVEGAKRFLVIDEDGNVTCDDIDVGTCREVDSVDEMDSLRGCAAGLEVELLPVAGKTIIGSDATPSKWIVDDSVSAHAPVDRTVVHSSHVPFADNTALRTDVIDITALPGYLADYKFAMLTFKYYAASSTSHFIHDVAVDGRDYVGAACGTDFEVPYHYNSALVKIPDTKQWTITNTRSVWIPGSATGLHNLDIWIDGWVK